MIFWRTHSVHKRDIHYGKEIKLSLLSHKVLLSIEFSRQEYWSGLPFATPRDLPDPVIKPMSLVSPVLAGRFFTTESFGIMHNMVIYPPSLSDSITNNVKIH